MRESWEQIRRGRVFQVVFTVGVAFVLALSVQAYAVKPYRIPSESMLPTLKVGDRVVANRFSHRLGSAPKVGQILIFTPPAGALTVPAQCGVPDVAGRACPAPTPVKASTAFVKRVVAVGGDTIRIQDGHVIRNGRRERDGFIRACGTSDGCTLPEPVRIPRGSVFLMGDNRGNSDDSRFWGPIPVEWVIGEASLRYWPPGRLGTP
ncbi:MAG: lepB [Solirubrobacterales bacterium]|nr:lepB [Solirubrobacterales bacterium]